MSANELLLWMSARVEGSWSQFRSAVERLHAEVYAGDSNEATDDAAFGELPLHQAVRLGLERLAHVEFTSVAGSQRWRVVPPVLATTRRKAEHIGILCGARSPCLHTSLSRLSNDVSVDQQTAPGMPDRIRLVSRDVDSLDQAAQELGLHVQPTAPAALLTATPPVDDPRSWFLADAPSTPGWTVYRFSTTYLRWVAADREAALRADFGMFRFQWRFQRLYFLRWQSRTFEVPVQVGKYVVLRRRRIRRLISLDRSHAVFSVPVICRPPLLIERALVLCSGRLPTLDQTTGRLDYRQVPPEIARMAAALLCQEINIA